MHAVLLFLTFLSIFFVRRVTFWVEKMNGSVLDTVRQRLCLASGVLGGLLELLDAASPDARVSPSGVRLLLMPAVEEVFEATRELGCVQDGPPVG